MEELQQPEKSWYALIVYPNREFAICERILKVAKNDRFKDQIFRAVVAYRLEEKTNKKGQTKLVKKVDMTQYVFVEMILNQETYHAVMMEGVRTIFGIGDSPTPIEPEQMRGILEKQGLTLDEPQVFADEDRVQIIDQNLGVFYLQLGYITDVDLDKQEGTVVISMFGRDTPIPKVKFSQIKHAKN